MDVSTRCMAGLAQTACLASFHDDARPGHALCMVGRLAGRTSCPTADESQTPVSGWARITTVTELTVVAVPYWTARFRPAWTVDSGGRFFSRASPGGPH